MIAFFDLQHVIVCTYCTVKLRIDLVLVVSCKRRFSSLCDHFKHAISHCFISLFHFTADLF